MALVRGRYLVDDVDAAVLFYIDVLGFRELSNASPAFADVVRGNLRLLLSGPTSSAGRPMPDGGDPSPEAGIEFISSLPISTTKPSGCGTRASCFAVTS